MTGNDSDRAELISSDEAAARYHIKVQSLYNQMSYDRREGMDVPRVVKEVQDGSRRVKYYDLKEMDAWRERRTSSRVVIQYRPEVQTMQSDGMRDISQAMIGSLARDLESILETGFPLAAVINWGKLAAEAPTREAREAIIAAIREGITAWGRSLED
jgi:hypothetical protein